MDKSDLPMPLKIEKVRNEIRYCFNRVSAEYELDGFIIDNLAEAVLNEEKQQRISQMVEMLTFERPNEETEEVIENGDTTQTR